MDKGKKSWFKIFFLKGPFYTKSEKIEMIKRKFIMLLFEEKYE